MKYKLAIIPVIVFPLILIFLLIGLGKDPTIIPSPLIGKNIPAFSSKELISNDPITNKDLVGEYSILNVWASWCTACYDEHDLLMSLSEKLNIPIYGLNYKDNFKDATTWLSLYGNPYKKIIFDFDGMIGIEFGVYGAPETFILDRKGTILYKHIGAIDEEFINNKLLPIINNEFE